MLTRIFRFSNTWLSSNEGWKNDKENYVLLVDIQDNRCATAITHSTSNEGDTEDSKHHPNKNDDDDDIKDTGNWLKEGNNDHFHVHIMTDET